MVLLTGQNWTSQISYDVAASCLRMLLDRAVLLSVFAFAKEYDWSLKAIKAQIDDDRYDMAE